MTTETSNPTTILLVGDTPGSTDVVLTTLEGAGYRVAIATNYGNALQRAALVMPDLILLNARWSGMDGYEVCRRLKADEKTRSVPVIFLSVLEDERDKVQGFEAGAVDYIAKPFQSEEVLARVRTHLSLREQTEHLERKVIKQTEELKIAHERLEQEIANRERAEEVRQGESALLRCIIDSISDLIYIKDRDGRYLRCNKASEKFIGLPESDQTGKTDFDFFDRRKADVIQKIDRQVLARGKLFRIEEWVTDRDGGRMLFDTLKTPYFGPKGEVLGLVGISRDVTAHKRAEEVRAAHLRFLESMDLVNRAIQGTTDPEQMLNDVLDVVLSIFNCDRALLLSPCDPEAAAWQSRIERTRPEYPGTFALGLVMPMDKEVAGTVRTLLSSDGPVKFGPGTGHPLPKGVSERFQLKSFMSMALFPRVGKPWQFGIHQCSHARAWTAEEERLFQEIGRRLEDGLASMLAYRNLRESEAEYRQIVDTANEGIWVVGPDTTTKLVNARMAEMLGWSAEEMIGRPMTDFMFEEDGPDHVRKMENRRQGIPEYYERRFRHQNGQTVWTHVSATPIFDAEHHFNGSFVMFTDISEHKRAEIRLSEQLHFLQQLLDSIPIPVYYKDKDGFYLGCNAAFEAFIGLPRKDVVGRTVREVAPKERADQHWQADLELLSQPGLQTYELGGKYKDGKYHDVIFNKATFVDANDCVAGTVGAMIDITSLKKAEEERKLLQAQLYQAQKMEAIGKLAGGIAHDFNNILTAIIGYSEIIHARMEKEDPLRNFIEQVLTAAHRATELTNGLLAFSRRQVLDAKPIDLCSVVQGLRKMLRRLLPEDIDLKTMFGDGNSVVMADKGQIEQVLMNLVTNAKDAMPRGGTLTIEVYPAVMDESFVSAHGFGKPGNYACISAADTGSGMDEETRKRIFEPFFTTKEVGKGTGLGMAIVYGIVKQHNGYIAVYSGKEEGTTFRIYLPLIVEEIKEVHGAREAEAPPGGTETILLAEDEVTVRELHKMILEEAGYRVVEAADGQDAFDKFIEHKEEVDILVTDVIMPKIDGKALYEKIRRTCPDMKVLFVSGHTKDIIMERGILENELSYLSKPVKPFELLKSVKDVLGRNRPS